MTPSSRSTATVSTTPRRYRSCSTRWASPTSSSAPGSPARATTRFAARAGRRPGLARAQAALDRTAVRAARRHARHPASAPRRTATEGNTVIGVHLVALAGGLIILTGMIELLRRRQLKEKYAVLWLLVAI